MVMLRLRLGLGSGLHKDYGKDYFFVLELRFG